MLVEEQISARQLRARTAIQSILAKPPGQGYGDYEVKVGQRQKISGGDARSEPLRELLFLPRFRREYSGHLQTH